MDVDEDEDDEIQSPDDVAPFELNRDYFATALMDYAAALAAAQANFFNSMALGFAGQAKKTIQAQQFHEQMTLDLESIPTTED